MSTNEKLVKFPGPGCLVEFMHGNAPQLAWVAEEQSGRLRLLTINKRETKLPASRLLPWSGPAYPAASTRQEIDAILQRHNQTRQDAVDGLGLSEIWEMAQGDVQKASAEWFAGLVFENPTVDQVAAMGRALLEDKTRFRFQPPEFEVFPADVVERRQKELEATRLRETLVEQGHVFFKDLWLLRGSGKKLKEPEPEVAEALRTILKERLADCADQGGPSSPTSIIAPNRQKAEELWNHLRKGLPDHPFLPLLLAQAWGIVKPHHNWLLDKADFEEGDGWSAAFADEIERHKTLFAERIGQPEETPYVSIDASTTRDIDDAFFARREDGRILLSVALARPTLTWEFGSRLDKAVFQRSTSLYLPESVSHMMPEALSTDLYSLRQSVPRPSLVIDVELDETGAVLSCAPRLATVVVVENVAYEDAERRIKEEPEDASLPVAFRAAQLLRRKRLERGAVIIERPDPSVELDETGDATRVDALLRESSPDAQLLVSELMILANSCAAQWAAERSIALYHRTQDIDLPPESNGVWERPEDIYRVVRFLGSTSLEPRPARHASLAAPAYAPLSSPLRRYPDLINVAQIQSFLETGQPLFRRDELEAMLPELSGRLDAVGQIQRFRPRYWKIEYLRQKKDCHHEAVVVEDQGQYVMASLPLLQIYVRAPRSLYGDDVHPGKRYQVKVSRADPLTNEIRLGEAWEE